LAKELSKKTIDIIATTEDLIVSNSTKITKRMYEILFNKYPHVKKLFANQPENQFMILAEALSLFAVNIDRIDKLKPTLQAIASSHVKTNVKSGHYPMVGFSLLTAMEDVLLADATVELIDAWRDAYQYLSEILIGMENNMYKEIKN